MDEDRVEDGERDDREPEDAEKKEEPGLRKCVKNLPWSWGAEAFQAYLIERKITFSEAKKRKNAGYGFVSFNAVEDAQLAAQELEKPDSKGKKLKVSDAFPRSWESEGKDGKAVKQAEEPKDICEAVTPLGAVPYEEQLQIKKESVVAVLKKFARETRKCCDEGSSFPDWLDGTRERGGMACDLEGIIPSPLVEGYRNKCEFSIGYSRDGSKAVGFQLGLFKKGITAVENAVHCRHVSAVAKFYASTLEEYVRASDLSVWDKETNAGFWRLLTVREGRNIKTGKDEVMVIVQVSPVGMTDEAKTEEYKRILETFSIAASKSSPPVSFTCFMIQEHNGVSNAASADAPLIPFSVLNHNHEELPQFIHDSIGDLQFRISPSSFFQVNTLAAEKLYALAGEWAELGPDTLLFDVCCGTGTIGLTLARKVGMVVGIELNAGAVEDARTNAELNGITNCRFISAKAEDVIKQLLNEYEVQAADVKVDEASSGPKKRFSNIVVIVDPPRSGLHPSVVKTLRVHSRLKRLVYISCNPETLVANAIELCAPVSSDKNKKQSKGRNTRGMTSMGYARQRLKSMPESQAFVPVKAMAVDLFPHTRHCEMVMLLER